jgi:hypothetical protein
VRLWQSALVPLSGRKQIVAIVRGKQLGHEAKGGLRIRERDEVVRVSLLGEVHTARRSVPGMGADDGLAVSVRERREGPASDEMGIFGRVGQQRGWDCSRCWRRPRKSEEWDNHQAGELPAAGDVFVKNVRMNLQCRLESR